MKILNAILVTLALIAMVTDCKKSTPTRSCNLVALFNPIAIPANDSSFSTLTLTACPANTNTPYQLSISNGYFILPNKTPQSQIIIYPNQWYNDSINILVRATSVVDSLVLVTISDTVGIVAQAHIAYLSQAGFDSYIISAASTLTAVPDTVTADGQTISAITFQVNNGNNIIPTSYQKQITFTTIYGNFITAGGVLQKQFTTNIDYNGAAKANLVADTLPRANTVTAYIDNNSNLSISKQVVFNAVGNTLNIDTTATTGQVITMQLVSSPQFVNKPVTFKSTEGVFLYTSPASNTYTTVFNSNGQATAYLSDSVGGNFNNGIFVSFLGGAYQLDTIIYFHP